MHLIQVASLCALHKYNLSLPDQMVVACNLLLKLSHAVWESFESPLRHFDLSQEPLLADQLEENVYLSSSPTHFFCHWWCFSSLEKFCRSWLTHPSFEESNEQALVSWKFLSSESPQSVQEVFVHLLLLHGVSLHIGLLFLKILAMC